jgi:hypothetical protein
MTDLIKWSKCIEIKESLKNSTLSEDERTFLEENIQSCFIELCRFGETELAKWLYDLSRGDKKAIKKQKEMMSKNQSNKDESKKMRDNKPYKRSNLDKLKRFCNLKKMERINIDENVFIISCQNSHVDMVKWLYEESCLDKNKKININYDNDKAFRASCGLSYTKCIVGGGCLNTTKWLYDLSQKDGNIKINIRAENDDAFRMSYYEGYTDISEWLSNLCPDYIIKTKCGKTKCYIGDEELKRSYQSEITDSEDYRNMFKQIK